MNTETFVGILVAVIQLLGGYVLQGLKSDIKSVVARFDTFISQQATHEADIRNFRERISKLEHDIDKLKTFQNGKGN